METSGQTCVVWLRRFRLRFFCLETESQSFSHSRAQLGKELLQCGPRRLHGGGLLHGLGPAATHGIDSREKRPGVAARRVGVNRLAGPALGSRLIGLLLDIESG